jgi:hypothetical protein
MKETFCSNQQNKKEVLKIKFDFNYFKNHSSLYGLYDNSRRGYIKELLKLKSNYSLFDLIIYPFNIISKIILVLLVLLWAITCTPYHILKSFINYDYGEKNKHGNIDITRLKKDFFIDGNRVYLNPIKGFQFTITIEEFFELLIKYIRSNKVDYFIDEFIDQAKDDFTTWNCKASEVKGLVIALGLKEVRKMFI